MKLVRLESDSDLTQSTFTNNMAVALQLNKNAKAAIKTLSMQFDEPLVKIDSTNNTLTFKTGDNGDTELHTVVLANGFYNTTELQTEIQNKMNNILVSNFGDTFDDNFEWKIEKVGNDIDGYNFAFSFNRDELLTINDTNAEEFNTRFTETGLFIKNTGDDDSYNAHVYCKKLLCRGGFILSIFIQDQVPDQPENVADSEWMFYVDKDLKTENMADEASIVNNMLFGVMMKNGHYAYKKNNVMVETNVDVVLGDVLTIFKNDGNIAYNVSRGMGVIAIGTGDNINATFPTAGSSDLYVNLKFGNDTGKIAFADVLMSPSPYVLESNGSYTELQTNQQTVYKKLGAVVASLVNLNFPSLAIRKLLGFKKPSYFKHAVSGSFVGESTLSINLFNNDIVVEIPELSLETYDHTYKQKRNIIMVITSGELQKALLSKGNEGFELSFTDIYPTYINLSNYQSTLTFPSLTVRVSSEGSLLPMSGKMSCLLLFKDETDLR